MSELRLTRERMRHHAYADDSKLAIRHRLHDFRTTPYPSERGRLFAVYEPRGDEVVVDVGCGSGQDIRSLIEAGHHSRLIGVDISTGMLSGITGETASLVCGDAAHLPLRSSVGDLVLAMSMLYHVAELDQAVLELRRVLKPGGVLLSSASSASNMPEFVDAWERAATDVTGHPSGLRDRWARTFNTENGVSILRRTFDSVDLHSFSWTLDPPDARSVRLYAESSRDFYGDLFEADIWTAVMDRLELRVLDAFERSSGFPITISKGIFVAR